MKKNVRNGLIFLLSAILIIPLLFQGTAMADNTDQLQINGQSAILVDAASGRILYQKNIDEPLHPASMTKMMTEYLLLESIKSGKIKWDQNVPISEYAHDISQNTTLSNVPLRLDGQYNVRELYESMAIYSANGSAIALAELAAGSEANFVKMMNDKAAQLGMKDYKFVNCTGLNNSDLMGKHPAGEKDEENVMSARSVAILAFRLLHDYPEVLKTSSIEKKVFKEGTQMSNWNWMLPGLVFGYKGVDGLKTGSTDLGGNSFTATAKRGDVRFISVIMKTSSKEQRFIETKKLLDYGFGNYSSKALYPAGYKISSKPELPVNNGKLKKVGVESKSPLVALVKKGEENAFEPVYKLDPKLSSGDSLNAPLDKDQVVGKLTINYKGSDNYGYLLPGYEESAPLAVTAQVKKAGWLTTAFRAIGNFFRNLFK